VTDITHIKTHEGWLYLSVVIDLFLRRVVGPLLSYDFRMPLDDTGANALHVFAVHWRGGSHPSWSLWAARE
jgi:transposase InsO family protein